MITASEIPASDSLSPQRRANIRLDSAPAGGRWSRWSYHPHDAILILSCDSATGMTRLASASQCLLTWQDPLKALGWLSQQCSASNMAGPPFKGGWIGFLAYDVGRLFERLPSTSRDDLQLPLFRFTFHPGVDAFDGVTGRATRYTISHSHDPAPIQFPPAPAPPTGQPLVAKFSRAGYENAVARAIEYISAGDVFQVNLSQRFGAPLALPPPEIYERLLFRHPAWFGAMLDYGDFALMCNSPELFLRVSPDRRVVTRPIKGTRPYVPEMDAALRGSIKDQAELNMIVDLERNDLGRVCEIGSVKVTEPRAIETHPTVYHGAATVEGLLRRDVGFVDLLRATFPGGSITGAPKIRAMEIIEELEPTRRGPYCGAIGFLSVDGHIEFNVAIRTMIATRGMVYIPVGGGVVADSTPAEEYEETLVKARAMFTALGIESPG